MHHAKHNTPRPRKPTIDLKTRHDDLALLARRDLDPHQNLAPAERDQVAVE